MGAFTVYTATVKPARTLATPQAILQSGSIPKADPTSYNSYDADLAKKLVLYHELAAQLDSYAIEHATQPEIKMFASAQSAYNTKQATVYATLLSSWNETFFRMDDFPKIPGSSCGNYPTFPGMLPHTEVNTFLQSSSEEVDSQYLRLITRHHNDIETTISLNKTYAANGELAKLREAFLSIKKSELKQIQHLQTQFLYV